jgi:YggT family protein
VANILCLVSYVALIVLFARAILSWFPLQQGGVAYQINALLFRVTEPVMGRLRSVLPSAGPIDISFLVVFLAIIVFQRLVC